MIKESLLVIAIWFTALLIIIGAVKIADAQKASYYSYEMGGRKTANGELFDPNAFTAASRTLPFGTKVKVTNLKNNKYVIVRINDRGPYVKGRTIDLSYAAAEQIDMIKSGVAEVEIVVLA
jgi:rare lipoprotein A